MTTPEPARGVDLAKVDLVVIDAALKASGVRRPRSATLADRVNLMTDHEARAIGDDKEKGGSCEHCGGISLMSRACCPYCGKADDEGMPPAEMKPVVPVKPTLAKTGGSSITTANVKELDQVTRRLKGLIGDTMSSHWQLGRELIAARKAGVWKYRLGSDNVPAHANFGAFCGTELGLSVQYVGSLMSVAEAFTEKQVRDLGVTKLKFIARVPEAVRGELLAKAPELPKREVERQAQQASGGKKAPQRKPKLSNAQPTRVVAPDEATAVVVPERIELRASGQPPTATHDLQNGMQLILKLTESEDGSGLATVLEFRRVDEAAAE